MIPGSLTSVFPLQPVAFEVSSQTGVGAIDRCLHSSTMNVYGDVYGKGATGPREKGVAL
jgi:hypothetical protein